jgi:5-methylcytosine-specific restriction endonuclease McrA
VYDTREWKRVRAYVLERDGRVCAWCGREANTVDHVHEVVNGGDNDPANLVAACLSCNSRRGQETRTKRDRATRTYRRPIHLRRDQ